MLSVKKSFPFGEHEITLETGEVARQADGAVIVSMADTRREGDADIAFDRSSDPATFPGGVQ